MHADINTYILELAAESFDSVIHDPPRFSLAGELYGEKFYREIHRVLKRGSRFVDHAAQRLRAAGFSKVTKVVELIGVTARK